VFEVKVVGQFQIQQLDGRRGVCRGARWQPVPRRVSVDAMDSVLAEWFKSTFFKRRWTVLTPTPFLVTGVQWLMNHLAPLPSDLRTASVWDAPWWLWVLMFMLCFSCAQILGWREQHSYVRELSGRPDVILSVPPSQDLMLRNPSAHVAVDVSALAIRVPVPGRIIEEWKQTSESFGVGADSTTEWVIEFGIVQNMAPGDICGLPFTISGMGVLQSRNLTYLMGSIATNFGNTELSLALTVSNLGPPKRTWHFHYRLLYAQVLVARRLSQTRF
jgi:hypothetical protein